MNNISKIIHDKYYTSNELAEYVVNKTKEIIGVDNIIEYIEPSAGSGVFLNYLDKPFLAYDIEPEDNRIQKQDYLKLDLAYKQGRCIIGNPPFGDKSNNLVLKFFKKSIELGDYISFILPISQYKNDINLFEFDLVYTEDLGKMFYSDREIHCCLNVYKRPRDGLNKKPNYNLKEVKIRRHTRNSQEIYSKDFDYDLRICCRGNNLGKVCDYENQYAKEYCIKVYNDDLRDRVIDLIVNADWDSLYPSVSSPYLAQWQVYKYIKEKIPEIE